MMDLLQPLPHVEKMLALPFEDGAVFEDWERYQVEYLSWVARLSKEHDHMGFWVPAAFWENVSMMAYSGGIMIPLAAAVWADEVVGLLPGPHEIGHEEIQALREWHPEWLRDTERTCMVVMNGAITEEFVTERVEPWLAAKGWTVTREWEGAGMAILPSGYQPLWRLPVDAVVVEFQQELAIRGEMQHLSHMSDLEPWVLLLSKGSVKDVQDQMMEQLEKWWKKWDAMRA